MIVSKINSDSTLYQNYLEVLKGRIFKILPLFEENNVGIFHYIQSLTNELYGLQSVIDGLDDSSHYLSLMATLESFSDMSFEVEYDLKFVKSEVFKCLSTVNKLQKKGE